MKRLRIPGIANIFKVDEPEEIRALAQDPRIDRKFVLRTCPFNWLLLKRSLTVLSFKERRFPTMTCRDSQERQIHQQELAKSLRTRAEVIRLGPEELDPLAQWVRGEGLESRVGMLTQQFLGRLFLPEFVATEESWAAAKILVAAPRSRKIFTVMWWFATGKLRRSKYLLAEMVNGDLSAVNAIGIAVHNVVKGLRHMRTLYADISIRSSLSPDAAARQCLFAPVSVYRQATDAGQLGSCPFPRNSLFVFEIGKASQREGGQSLVFMGDTWSQCPAAEWVPAMLEGVWLRATGDAAKSR
ncbi:MAG: hypothetical protein WDM80_11305 [Limisphaerales bacterium]